MSGARLFDAILYTLVNYIAYIPLVMYPFRKKLRYPKWVSAIILALLSVMFFIMTLEVMDGMSSTLIPIINIISVGIIMACGIREHFGKTLMTYLIVYNMATFVTVFAKYAEAVFFPQYSQMLYHWTHTLFIAIGCILVYLLDGWYNIRIYEPLMNTPNNSRVWNYIWITPLSFYLIWMLYIYHSPGYQHGMKEDPFIVLCMLMMTFGSFVTYYLIVQLVYVETERDRLEYQESINRSQYKNLSKRIDEARRARHDLRHHLRMIDAWVKEENYEALREYLNQYETSLPDDMALSYCSHYATNALLLYFAQEAKKYEIRYDVICNLNDTCPIKESDLTIMFGNLLENAVNAARNVTGRERFITVRANYNGQQLLLSVANSAVDRPHQDHTGRYLSTTHAGYGIGIDSIRQMAESYHGVMNTHYQNHVYETDVMMLALQNQNAA